MRFARIEMTEGGARPSPRQLNDLRIRLTVESYREEIQESPSGSRAMMSCLALLLQCEMSPPKWLTREFARRVALISDLEESSWDKALGPPFPANYPVAINRQRWGIKLPRIVAAMQKLFAEQPKRAIDKEFWASVGRESSLSAGTVTNIFDEAVSNGLTVGAVDMRTELLVWTAKEDMRREQPMRARDEAFWEELAHRSGATRAFIRDYFDRLHEQSVMLPIESMTVFSAGVASVEPKPLDEGLGFTGQGCA